MQDMKPLGAAVLKSHQDIFNKIRKRFDSTPIETHDFNTLWDRLDLREHKRMELIGLLENIHKSTKNTSPRYIREIKYFRRKIFDSATQLDKEDVKMMCGLIEDTLKICDEFP